MKRIRFNEPFVTGRELGYIEEVFQNAHFHGAGPFTKYCENLIRERVNPNGNVLLTDSCTSALEICALLLRDRERTQEVILPSYTFSTTASAFLRAGFQLVFAEIDPTTMMLDVADVEKRLSSRTCAVVAVHYAGQCADLLSLSRICRDSGAILVEDAAQAFDMYLNGQAVGSFGDLACYSFHETKNIHSGLSGALVVNTDRFGDRPRHIWERGTNRQAVLKGQVDKYSWVEIGGSFYPSELQAAFLRAQLEAVDENTEHRRSLYRTYVEGMLELRKEGRLTYPDIPPNVMTNGHAFFIVARSPADADEFREHFRSNRIDAYIGYVPLHSSTVGRQLGFAAPDLPLTEEYAQRVLRLPLHNQLSVRDVEWICEVARTAGG